MSGPIKVSPVESSNIAAVGYDPATKVCEIHFHSGARWQYHGVPADAHHELVTAANMGSHFAQVFRKAGYATVKGPEK